MLHMIKFGGKMVSPIGIGTWHMGGNEILVSRNRDKEEIAAIRFAIENGINVIDTAEMYSRGHAEELVGQAIKGFDREKLYIITKVLPTHAKYESVLRAAQNSVERLGTYADLYLYHWPNPLVKIGETISAMEKLVDEGKVKSIGVSNFGVRELEEAVSSAKKYEIVANQIHYSVMKKGPESELIPFCEKNKIKVIAYTPIEYGRVAMVPEVQKVAKEYDKTPIQVALSYLTKRSLPVPKASRVDHLKEILGAMDLKLKEKDYERIASA